MRGVVAVSVLLASAGAFAQSVTVETCVGVRCIEAVDPSTVHGLVGRAMGNPEPMWRAPTASEISSQAIEERNRSMAAGAKAVQEMKIRELVGLGMTRAQAEATVKAHSN